MILSTGDMFRRFQVLGKAGEGGMGIVYRAHDTKLDRDVALKFVTQAGEANSELCERLRREARSLAALSHPNIVAIHDIDEIDGIPFLVLEWITGAALSDKSFRRVFSVDEFCRVALPIAEALGAAHERGIIHRDVKPSNILITTEGRTKVVDFGLAKLRNFAADGLRTHGAVGTVRYMSPEQAAGEELSAASDIFSFGILAYELLTGMRPFEGQGLGSVLSAIMSARHTALREVRPDLPSELVAAIERCLEREPKRRFDDGRDLATALLGVSGSRSSEAEQVSTIALPVPSISVRHEQDIQFCTTADGFHIAYSTIGTGPLLVRVLGFFTHLEMEWEWPDLRYFWERLAERYTVLRYDGRGIGLSEHYDGEFTEETRQLDLHAVLSAVGAQDVILLGVSEGGWTAATYANKHAESVTHLILYGCYCRGAQVRPEYDPEEDEALATLIRKGWGRDTPKFRQMFTSSFFRPDADPKLLAHFNEMQRAAADPETAARYHLACHTRGDGREIFQQITVPTLILQSRDDMAVDPEEARLLASIIPGSHLVFLPSGTHYFPTDRDVVVRLVNAINRFVDATHA